MSDRKPTQFPVWGFARGWWREVFEICDGGIIPDACTHWKPMERPEPPLELTQREDDYCAFRGWLNAKYGPLNALSPSYALDVWHAALAYRDNQNREDLRNSDGIDWASETPMGGSMIRLRRRCGLDT